MRASSLLFGIVALTLTAGLVGCSSTAPQPAAAKAPLSPAPDAAVVADAGDNALMTVYRKKRFVGMALHTSVYVDGTEIAELGNGAYVKVKVAPGQHRVWADEESDAITVGFETGKGYFFRMELVPGMWKGNGRMVAVDEATGKQELAEAKPKPTEDIKVPAMVVQ
jgi:hypothetical protein